MLEKNKGSCAACVPYDGHTLGSIPEAGKQAASGGTAQNGDPPPARARTVVLIIS